MRILLTIHHELDPNKGAPGVTLKLGEEYQKLGHQVQFYSMDNLPPQIAGKAKGLLFPWFLAAHLSKLCRDQAVDVVDASTGDAWVWARMRQRNSTSHQYPLLVTRSHGLEHTVDIGLREEAQQGNLHLSWKYELYSGAFRLWEVENSLRFADQAFFLNRDDLEYAVEKLRVKSECAKIIVNGIPETFLNLPFDPTPTSSDSMIGIAVIASYTPRKGMCYSAPALNAILGRYPRVKVSLLGTEVSEDEVLADFESSIRDRVCVVPHYPHGTLPSLLKGHQIKLFPSIAEGFGMVLVEAMACGLAPIATETQGPREIVSSNRNGILIPPRDQRAIEQALERMITDRTTLDRLRRNAYTTAQDYSWTRIAQHQITLYEEALEKSKNL
jgi:glycosyltransferase involved in cell wall biosynthesis